MTASRPIRTCLDVRFCAALGRIAMLSDQGQADPIDEYPS